MACAQTQAPAPLLDSPLGPKAARATAWPGGVGGGAGAGIRGTRPPPPGGLDKNQQLPWRCAQAGLPSPRQVIAPVGGPTGQALLCPLAGRASGLPAPWAWGEAAGGCTLGRDGTGRGGGVGGGEGGCAQPKAQGVGGRSALCPSGSVATFAEVWPLEGLLDLPF